MNNCIFCKIINKEIPSTIIYENEHLIAFLDINPMSLGHTLVVPKIHSESVFDTDQDVMANVSKSIPIISNLLKEKLNCIGLTVISNNLKPNQDVLHFHIHLIPRYENDKFSSFYNSENFEKITFDANEIEKVKDLFK